jgi:hypothetical protein
MGLFGRNPPRQFETPQATQDDEQALARYRYMLKTAPPETLEQAHAEAFAKLTPEQRSLLLQRLAESAPPAERASAEQGGASPQALARMATRAEVRQPGSMERVLGQTRGVGLGGLMAGSLLSSIAGAVIGSMIAREFFSGAGQDAAPAEDAADAEDASSGDGGDLARGDGFDIGGDFDV